ncbi:MAG TPA: hypothetical protein VHD56_17080 [Tepidisphaeraceae bacterium]|nr:hypothetical protein [Tepidisphaeraceae bacterium]
MTSAVETSLALLRDISSVAEMKDLAGKGYAPSQRPKVNSHIHLPPNFSAFNTVQQAVDLASEQSVGVLGVSNYYDYDVYGPFIKLAKSKKIFPLFGLEIICMIDDLRKAGVKINDPGNPGKMYICGKGITRFAKMTPQGSRLLNLIRKNDSTRMDAMIQATEKVFSQRGLPTGTNINSAVEMIVKRHGSPRQTVYLQERHIAQAFQEATFARVNPEARIEKLNTVFGAATKARNSDDFVTVQNDLRTYLLKAGKPAFVDETFIGFEDAYKLILELGGYPCYPTLADGNSPICAFEEPVERLIQNIKDRNVHTAEFIPVRNAPDVLSKYVKAMRAAGLAITAGTEHNTLDLIPIEPTCKNGVPIPEDLKQIFWEGACVAAGHQFLSLHGQIGFVDSNGNPNPNYKTAEDRITAFAKLGAAVIRKYQET